MKRVFATANSIVSPLGLNAADTFTSLKMGKSGLKQINPDFLTNPTYASVFSNELWKEIEAATSQYNLKSRFEQLLLKPILDVIKSSGLDASDKGVILVIATTKGNIDDLGKQPESQLLLPHSAHNIANAMGCKNIPIVVSNACISGLSAIITAHRLLKSGFYHTAIVAGADVLGKFIISGFNALNAMSTEPCRPFDHNRQGINLGEGSAALILQLKETRSENDIEILGGCVTNDANHVSAPSRTGEELATAISSALAEASLEAGDLQFVSAHGTATLYNDEMEAKALNIAGISHLPTHSLKGFFGHTLGAAGLIESIVCFHSLIHKEFIASAGFEQQGTSVPVNICTNKTEISAGAAIKTMAGFGGCNAALVFSSGS